MPPRPFSLRTVGVRFALLLTLGLSALAAHAAPTAPAIKPRVFILTDVENEPDDTQSLVRLMLYANELDLRGLVATTSVHMKTGVHPESIRRVIEAYGQVLPRLRQHDRRVGGAVGVKVHDDNSAATKVPREGAAGADRGVVHISRGAAWIEHQKTQPR
jgi:hypothetical protein